LGQVEVLVHLVQIACLAPSRQQAVEVVLVILGLHKMVVRAVVLVKVVAEVMLALQVKEMTVVVSQQLVLVLEVVVLGK
jgi:hypothetical protein